MSSLSTQALQKMQQEYDEKYWDHNGFSTFENIRHLTLHVGKLVGKLSTYCEAMEHERNHPESTLKEEVIPDLLGYALQLSNWLGEDLGRAYEQRLKSNVERFSRILHVDNA